MPTVQALHQEIHMRRSNFFCLIRTTLAVATTLATALALAAFPDKPIRILMPFPPGGPSDTTARAIAPGIAQELKQSVVVENLPGASGAIAAQAVMRAPADGYTLLWVPASMGVLPHIQTKPAFKSLADFTPIATMATFSFGLFVHPDVPASTVTELVSYAKANPGKLTYATGAPSEHVIASQFIHQTQVNMLRVPYKGGAQAMPDLLAGRVNLFFTPFTLGLPHVRSGKLKLLATVTGKRSPLTPGVPTLEEAGIKGVAAPLWQGIVAPPNLPDSIAAQIAHAITKSVEPASVRNQFADQGIVVNVKSLQEFEQQLREDNDLWKKFVIDNDIPKE